MKKVILFLLTSLFLTGCSRIIEFYNDSSRYDLPTLSLEEMLADFEYLSEIVIEANPHFPVAESIYSIDIESRLSHYKSKITAETSPVEFYEIINCALQSAHGHHLTPANWAHNFAPEVTMDSVLTSIAISKPYYHDYYPPQEDGLWISYLATFYIEGGYYVRRDTVKYGELIPAGSEVIEIDGTEINTFINTKLSNTCSVWDTSEKHFVKTSFFYYAFLEVDGPHTFSIRFPDNSLHEVTRNDYFITDEEENAQAAIKPDRTILSNVRFFSENDILYIKLEEMETDLARELISEIGKAVGENPVERIIIDMRNNGGGSDMAWTNLIQYLTGEAVHTEYIWGIRDSKYLRGRRLDDFFQGEKKRISFLDNTEYILSKNIYTGEAPSENLGYDGQIFLLSENNYSSAGAFAEYAKQQDNITLVGKESGYLLGVGTNPLMFTLPHSNINFRMEPVVDLKDVNSAEDVMHDSVEVRINPTLDQIVKMYAYSGDLSSYDYLFNYDVYIAAVMALNEG